MVTSLMSQRLGGTTTCVLNGVQAYTSRLGAECVVAYVSFDDEDLRQSTSAITRAGGTPRAFRVNRSPRDAFRLWALSLYAPVWFALNVTRFDIVEVHSAWNWPVLCAAVSARLRKVPCVVLPHESLTTFDIRSSQNRLLQLAKETLARLYRRLATKVVFSSRLEQENSLGMSSAVVVPHGVSTEPRSAPSRRSTEVRTIGFLGRFHPKKRAAWVVEAFASLQIDKVELVMAGDGQERPQLERLASELGVSDRVRWLGFLDSPDVERFFASIDVLAMPSAFECFGMSAGEALAHGLPVIVTDSVGLADLIQRDGCGWVIRSRVEDLRVAMEGALLPGAAERAGEAAVRTVASALTFDAYADAMSRVHEESIASVRGA